MPAWARALSMTATESSQIREASCSTQPGLGKIWGFSMWAAATTDPRWSNTMNRVEVVPWSRAPTNSAITPPVRRLLLRALAIAEPALDDIGGVFHHRLDLGALRRGEGAQHVVRRVRRRRRPSHPDLETGEPIGAQMLFQGADPVVAAAPPAHLDAKTPEVEIDVVMDHQQVLWAHLEVVEHCPDRLP